MAGNVLIATGPECTFPEAYKVYPGVFSEADSKLLSTHGLEDLSIELLDGKQQPWGPIHSSSRNELDTLHFHLETQLKRG